MECKNNEETRKIDECNWRNEESGSERFGIIRGQVESCMSEGVRVIYTGGEESKNGIAILLDEKVARCLDGVERYGDRLIMVTIRAHPVNIVIMQVYMPTTAHEEDEVESIYEIIEERLEGIKGKEFVIVMPWEIGMLQLEKEVKKSV